MDLDPWFLEGPGGTYSVGQAHQNARPLFFSHAGHFKGPPPPPPALASPDPASRWEIVKASLPGSDFSRASLGPGLRTCKWTCASSPVLWTRPPGGLQGIKGLQGSQGPHSCLILWTRRIPRSRLALGVSWRQAALECRLQEGGAPCPAGTSWEPWLQPPSLRAS